MPTTAPTIVRPQRWQQPPETAVRVRPYWLGKGLQRLYLLRWPHYYMDLITHTDGGTPLGTGPIFGRDYLESSTTPTATFSLDLGFDLGNSGSANTLITSQLYIAGAATSLGWSILDTTIAGLLGFLGAPATTGGPSVGEVVGDAGILSALTGLSTELTSRDSYSTSAFAFLPGVSYRVAFNNRLVQDITGIPVITTAGVPLNTVVFGLQRTSTDTKFMDVRTRFFGVANQAWDFGELRAITAAPYGELFERDPQRVYIPLIPPVPPPFTWFGQTVVSGTGSDAMIPSGSNY